MQVFTFHAGEDLTITDVHNKMELGDVGITSIHGSDGLRILEVIFFKKKQLVEI